MAGAMDSDEPRMQSSGKPPEGRAIGSEHSAASDLVSRAIQADRFKFEFQSIRGSADSTVILYRECLVRLLGEDGRQVSSDSFLPDLNETGLIGLFDQHMVARVITLLDKHPESSLGINVSALSATCDELWAPTLILLSSRPDIARRLVVEIHVAKDVDPVAVRSFVRSLRRSGCRVAIDDFGSSDSFSIAKEIPSADIVKINGSWITKVNQRRCSFEDLRGLVEIARGFASRVVVEGIETESDLRLACSAGVDWVQGSWFGLSVPRVISRCS